MTTPPSRPRWRRVIEAVKGRGRRLAERLERRRAEALRRRPARLIAALRDARSVLVLCQGNVARSVFASQLLARSMRDVRPVTIGSAGLATKPGWRAHPRVAARCAALGIDVTRHASRPVTAAMLRAADLVLVMEVSQLVSVARETLSARRKTFLLSTLAPDVALDIEDPAGKDDTAVDVCLDHIMRAVKPMVTVMTSVGAAPGYRINGMPRTMRGDR